MRKHTSLYLDTLRILAAMAVFFSHLKREHLSAGNPLLLQIGQFGQEGVAVFFVISGIVIAFVAREKERDFRSYLVARLGRLWSVIVPALVLTVVLDTAGRAIAPAMYAEPGLAAWHLDPASAWRFLAPLLFLNQSVLGAVDPGTNGPFWSLGFEFWYYILFGLAYFLRGALRLLLLAVAAVVAGPYVLMLLPLWALGLVVQASFGRFSLPRLGRAAWVATSALLLAVILFKYKLATLISTAFPHAGIDVMATAGAISRFAVAIACAANILTYDASGGARVLRIEACQRAIRYLAARSFSLYLYQAPCLFFFGALTYGMPHPVARVVLVAILSLLAILLLAELTERRKSVFAACVDRMLPETIPGLKGWRRHDAEIADRMLAK